MSEHTHEHHHEYHHDHSCCANLFGCGNEKGTGILREDIKDAVFDKRTSDRLLNMDEVDQETFDGYLSVRGRWRRKFLQASGFMGALAAVEPWFGRLARAQGGASPAKTGSAAAGRVHVVPSTKETVRLGVFDANLPPVVTIESGDIISFPDTWSHFLNEMQPGVPVDTLAKLRVSNPGRGPHSIIGPVAVNKAEPGDVLEIRYQTLRPYEWGAVFNNPGSLGTGLLPQDYAQGQIKYVDLDLSELSEGSTLYLPVWKPGALIYTGDSHAVQGDGEICLTALETRMKEVRVQVILHKQRNLAWPVAETNSHWITLGLDKDLNVAMTLAARNAIKFLAAQAKISELDAYALCSIAVSFRVTQVVDIVRGVHAMIPKAIFAADLRREMTVV